MDDTSNSFPHAERKQSIYTCLIIAGPATSVAYLASSPAQNNILPAPASREPM